MKTNHRFHYAWIILIALCVIRSLSAAGINNTGGLFLKPVADELGIGIGNLSIYFSISSLATLLFMPFGGKLIQRFQANIIILAAVFLQAGSFILLGFMTSVWAWYLLSIPMGVGGALLVNLIGPILINRWFSSNAGKALGILMACAGLFGAVLQPIVTHWITTQGWRQTYIILGVLVLVVVTITDMLWIRNDPSDRGMSALGDHQLQGIHQSKQGISYAQAKKSSTFYCLLFFMVAITAFGAFQQHLATYGAALGYASGSVGFVLSFGMVGSAIGAVAIGALSDRFGVYKATLCVIGIVLLSIVCLFTSAMSFSVFAAAAFLLGLGAMGIPVLAPLITKHYFGERDYEMIYSGIMVGAPLATIVLLPLYGFIYDLTGSYFYVFVLLVIIVLLGTFSIMRAQRKANRS